jgi:proline racemase
MREAGRGGERVRAQVLPRSTFAIFQYLGHIVAAERSGRITLQSADATGRGPLFDDQLFDIAIDANAVGDCFLDVAYGGHNYCVPEHGARNTKRILGLLAQLIALSTSLSGIPVTQQVQLIQ